MKKRYFSTFQLILLALFAALVVVAKIALRTPFQLSGHSGLFWMAIVIVAAGVVPKPGATTVVGLTSGIIAAFLGMGDFGALNTFLSYTMVGVGTDLALLLLRDPENPGLRCGGRLSGPFLQIPGQVDVGNDHRRTDRLRRAGVSTGDCGICRFWCIGGNAGQPDAAGPSPGGILCLSG